MWNLLLLLAAMLIGLGAAVQTSMLGSVGRLRGPSEATWLSILATASAVAVILAVRGIRGDSPALPAPFDRPLVFIGAALLAGLALLLTARGLPPYYAITGLFGLAFIFGAATLVPRIGVALFLGATIAGQLVGAIFLDQFGAFGATAQPVTPLRLAGVTLLLLGVVMVRGFGR
jgi:bacterial/archaeal transporter family-2 protein